MAEPQLLGDRVLPESIRQRRQSLRSRVQDLRQPIRQRRENLSPVNVVGMVESNVRDLRDRIVSRTDVLTRIRDRRGGSSGGSGSNSGSGSNGSSSNTTSDTSAPKPGRGRGDDVDELM